MRRSRVLVLGSIVTTLVVTSAGCSSCKKDGSESGSSSSSGSSGGGTSSSGKPAVPATKVDTSTHLGALLPAKNPFQSWKMATDSFAFPNYGPGKADLRPAEMSRLCGVDVCANGELESCELDPSVGAAMKQLNKMVGGGHCEGMAILSVLMQRGMIDPPRFGADDPHSLALEGNEPLQHELAYWWATQLMDPVRSARTETGATETPNDVVASIRNGIAKDEPVTLAFWMRNHTAGHATLPFGVVDKGEGLVWILHYDNNYPGEERHIEVDTGKNTWKYTTSADPSQTTPDDYEGDGETHTLHAVPLANRVGEITCMGEGNADGAGTAGSLAKTRTIFLEGQGHLLIADEEGHHLGFFGGKFVSEIPGGSFLAVPTGKAEEPIYSVPTGKKLTIIVDGATLTADDSVDVTVIGPGYVLAVEDIMLSPNEKDSFDLAPDWSVVSYVTEGKETPTLRLGVSTSGPDFEIAVAAVGEKSGQKLTLGIDLAKGEFSFLVHGGDGDTAYSVDLERIDAKGKAEFKHKGMSAGEDKAVLFQYGTWKGDKAPLHVVAGGSESDVGDED